MRLSEKIAALTGGLVFITITIILILAFQQFSSYWQERSASQLQSNARTAAALYEKRLAELRSTAQKLAVEITGKIVASGEATDAERNQARAQVQDILSTAQNELKLDVLIVADLSGRVLVKHNDQPAAQETLLAESNKNPIADRVLLEAKFGRIFPLASPVIEKGERLAQLNLTQRAKVEGRSGEGVENALMFEAGAPLYASGRFFGLLLIGQIANNSVASRSTDKPLEMSLDEEARKILYNSSEGGVAIATGSVVVASNINAGGDSGGQISLVGVGCDPASKEEKINAGDVSYIACWHSLKSFDGSDVGAIGALVPESQYFGPSGRLKTILILIAIVAIVLSGAAGFLFGMQMGKRVNALTDATGRMAVGELSRGVEDPLAPVGSRLPDFLSQDEITRLAGSLDEMRESFRQAIERLRKR
jgi:hypothetical protein